LTDATAYKLLKQIEMMNDRAPKGVLKELAGGEDGYGRYFGPSGHLTRKWNRPPHPVLGVNRLGGYQFVEVWEEVIEGRRTILHRRTDDGKTYQKLLYWGLLYYEPYSGVRGGKLQRK